MVINYNNSYKVFFKNNYMNEGEDNLKINFEKDETYLEKLTNSMGEIFEKHISESEKYEKDLFEHWKKPEWDEYFISMAILISMRSVDPSQKNGCVIVDDNNRVLSVGYNGFPRGSMDELIPLKRPDKHLFFIHAEKNAILNKQFDIRGATMYVTAVPCLSCIRTIIQSGIKRVVYLDSIKTREISNQDEEAIKKLMVGRENLKLEKFEKDPLLCLYKAIEYYKMKKMSKEKLLLKDNKMKKEDQKILVVENKILFGFNEHYFQGFKEHAHHDYETKILSNMKIMRRGATHEPENHPKGNAEKNYFHKQPIGYALVVNKEKKQVFAYQRASKKEHYGETRLQGKWSWGVGGHIEHFEAETKNPIKESLLREIKEEIKILGNIKDTKVLGYINYDNDDVGKVHFGILYVIETDGDVMPNDSEMAQGKLIHINELEAICSSENHEVEEWSKIALNPLKKYFEIY